MVIIILSNSKYSLCKNEFIISPSLGQGAAVVCVESRYATQYDAGCGKAWAGSRAVSLEKWIARKLRNKMKWKYLRKVFRRDGKYFSRRRWENTERRRKTKEESSKRMPLHGRHSRITPVAADYRRDRIVFYINHIISYTYVSNLYQTIRKLYHPAFPETKYTIYEKH